MGVKIFYEDEDYARKGLPLTKVVYRSKWCRWRVNDTCHNGDSKWYLKTCRECHYEECVNRENSNRNYGVIASNICDVNEISW